MTTTNGTTDGFYGLFIKSKDEPQWKRTMNLFIVLKNKDYPLTEETFFESEDKSATFVRLKQKLFDGKELEKGKVYFIKSLGVGEFMKRKYIKSIICVDVPKKKSERLISKQEERRNEIEKLMKHTDVNFSDDDEE